MIVYCKKCGINWASLRKIEDESNDEVYEVCPLCSSSSHLEDGNSLTAFICNPITGRITDYETGEPLQIHLDMPPIRKRYNPSVPTKTPQEYEKMQEDLISEYHKQFA